MKVSIITIVYNNGKYVEDCIQSVISQDYDNIEYVVIDGNSGDATLNKISEYEEWIDCIVSEKDNGLYDALNKGISIASGDVIGMLHSDDVFYDNSVVSRMVDFFQKENADIVYGKGVYVEKENLSKIRRIYSSNSFKKSYLYFGWIPLHTTMFVKGHVFEKYGFYDLSYAIAGDYDISLRWFLNDAIKKFYVDSFLVKMRLGGISTTANLQKTKSREDLRIIKKYNLWGYFTLFFKIARKIPQYVKPLFCKLPE